MMLGMAHCGPIQDSIEGWEKQQGDPKTAWPSCTNGCKDGSVCGKWKFNNDSAYVSPFNSDYPGLVNLKMLEESTRRH